MAGLVCFYNTENYYYLRVTHDASQNGDMSASMLQDDNICIKDSKKVYLKAVMNYSDLQFYYRLGENQQLKVDSKRLNLENEALLLEVKTLSDRLEFVNNDINIEELYKYEVVHILFLKTNH